MAKAQMLVFATAVDGQRETLDRWYDERHIPDLLKVSGLVSAKRYDLRTLKAPEGFGAPDFLAVYQLEGDDIGAILRDAGARMGSAEMPTSPALDGAKTIALVASLRTDKA